MKSTEKVGFALLCKIGENKPAGERISFEKVHGRRLAFFNLARRIGFRIRWAALPLGNEAIPFRRQSDDWYKSRSTHDSFICGGPTPRAPKVFKLAHCLRASSGLGSACCTDRLWNGLGATPSGTKQRVRTPSSGMCLVHVRPGACACAPGSTTTLRSPRAGEFAPNHTRLASSAAVGVITSR